MFAKIGQLFIRLRSKVGVLGQFAIYSFIVMSLIGVVLYKNISNQIELDVTRQLKDDALLITETIISPVLQTADFEEQMNQARFIQIDNLIKKTVYSKKIKHIKIWSRQGKLIYSDYRVFINKKFPLDDGLKQSLKGTVSFNSDPGSDRENQAQQTIKNKPDFNQLYSIYSPIRLTSAPSVIGAYEIYISRDQLNSYLLKNRSAVIKSVGLGLLLLYLTLVWFFGRAYRDTSRQTTELETTTKQLKDTIKDLENSYLDTMHALSNAVDAKDHYTAGHSRRVANYAKRTGRFLGLSQKRLINLERAALFHDTGKIGIKDEILNKKGPLTESEFREIRKHSTIGSLIIGAVKFLQPVIPIVEGHHEHFDGKGYPNALVGEEIALEARILSVADAFDAMTTDRPNRKAMSTGQAIAEIKRESGKQFDPHIVEAFIEMFKRQSFGKDALNPKIHAVDKKVSNF